MDDGELESYWVADFLCGAGSYPLGERTESYTAVLDPVRAHILEDSARTSSGLKDHSPRLIPLHASKNSLPIRRGAADDVETMLHPSPLPDLEGHVLV